jgi:hypothetical protein
MYTPLFSYFLEMILICSGDKLRKPVWFSGQGNVFYLTLAFTPNWHLYPDPLTYKRKQQ